jgi:hypothetical protein
LERLRIKEGTLHRVQAAIGRKPFEGHHGSARGSKRRNKAAMHSFAVQPDRASAAVTRIAAFPNAKPSLFAGKRT